jgi:predicted anti-sigma-YlaC factor YlaD
VTRCEYIQKIMQKVIDRTAGDAERTDLEQHISLCRTCATEFKSLQLSLDLLISMPVPEACPEFTSETVKRAFRAKKDQVRRQKVMSWYLSGVTAVISALIVASWSMIFQPATRGFLLSILRTLSGWIALYNGLSKALSVLLSGLAYLGDTAVKIIWEVSTPALFGYLTALIIMVIFIIIAGVKSSTLSLKGGKV